MILKKQLITDMKTNNVVTLDKLVAALEEAKAIQSRHDGVHSIHNIVACIGAWIDIMRKGWWEEDKDGKFTKYFENAVENETTEKKTATALDFNKLKEFIKTQLKQFSELDIKVSDEEKRICDDIDRYINKYYDELVSGRRNKKELEAIAQEAEEEDEKVDEED